MDQFPGEEYFGGTMRLSSRAKEQWASLAWSYPITARTSMGITTNGTFLDAGKGSNDSLEALSQTNDVAIYQFAREVNYKHYGLGWKVGFASSFKNVEYGMTLTTPVITNNGKGKYSYNKIFSGINSSSDNTEEYTTNRQSGFRLTDRFDDVLNVGLGSEIYLRDELYFYASLCTDFSAIPENLTSFSSNQPTAANSTFTANLYHFAGGFVINFPTAEPTMGATITDGKQQIARPVNFPDDGEDNIFDTTQTATLEWDRLRFVFSISVPFLDKKTREIIKKRNK